MKQSIALFPLAFKFIFKDPINLILMIIPAIVSLALYILALSSIIFKMDVIIAFISGYVTSQTWAGILGTFVTGLLVVLVILAMNWTFVLLAGLIAAPFNALISARIERKVLTKAVESTKEGNLKSFFTGLGSSLMNEVKKIIFISILSVIAFLFNVLPLFYPVALFIFSILIAIQFIDYSWSRHELSFGNCFKDVRSNLFVYGVTGFFFLMLVSIPLVNIFIPALATSFFTLLWLQKHNHQLPLQ